MINNITIEGRITKDIELKTFNETKVINNTIAVYGGKDKDNNDITYFFDFKAFNYIAEQLSKNAQKGSKIVLNGTLKQDKWESDGETKTKVIIYAENIAIMGTKQEPKKETPKEIQEDESSDMPW